MEILIFILSAAILYGAFHLLNTMPKVSPRNEQIKFDYDDHYIAAATKINSIKKEEQINDADISRLKFVIRFKNDVRVNNDNETLKLQIDAKKNKFLTSKN